MFRQQRWVSDPVFEEIVRLLRKPEPPAEETDDLARVRKQVYDLAPTDLEDCAIWEFALDEEGEEGQDEATVRPRPDLDVADPGRGYFVVRAEFAAHDGTRFDGYATACEDDALASVQPTIVTDRGQVRFWLGAFGPRPAELETAYELLAKTAEALFPLRYRAVVPVRGGRVEGVIPAFLRRRSPELR